MIVLDFGSGNTCGNDVEYARRMIDELAAITDRRDIIIKWQLFESAPPNVPLEHWVYTFAREYAHELGFATTASVFDDRSLRFLLQFDAPFVKIANSQKLWGLALRVPKHIPIVQSYSNSTQIANSLKAEFPLCCVSKYPATIEQYEAAFESQDLVFGISDHTVGFDLESKHQPMVWEKHYVLERNDSNPDAGPFAVTPDELREVL